MAVDNTTVLPTNSTTGRNSINIASKHTFSAGLWIFSVEHLPLGPGLWPAYWSYGYYWPYEGEIDIFETFYVNSSLMNYNTMTLHTGYNSSAHCFMPTDAQKFSTGFYLRNDCDSNGTHDSGCGVAAPPGTYNVGFNQAGGGVFAMEWDPERKFIRGWNFVKPNIPSDINSPNPNPETWGMPMAYFPLGDNCTSDHFRNHTIVMDMAFCGGAANYIFPGGVNGCIDVARNQPSAYSEAYWLFDYIKVFCKPGQNCIAQ